MRRSNSIVTVGEELWYLDRYVHLQQHRYGDRFVYRLQAENELMNAMIPKFTIQPLVENAFIHAVEESVDPVTIDVHVTRENDLLVITVSDDGPGLSPSRERQLRRRLYEKPRPAGAPGNGLGLVSIHDRIQHLYGRKFGVSLQPKVRGLTVQVTMPLSYHPGETSYKRPALTTGSSP